MATPTTSITVPVCLDDFEQYAYKTLPKFALDYYRSGADAQTTLRDNINAFNRFKILPRVLRDVSKTDTQTSILGCRISFPVCVAPTAMHRMAHPDGEVASAKAAAWMNTAFTLSTIATTSMEEIASAVLPSQNAPRFFQLYIYRERDVTRQLVTRAERAGFAALVLTVDTPLFGKRRDDNRNKFRLPPHLKMANFEGLDFKQSGVSQANKESGLNEYASSLFDASLTWKDVDWLRSITKLPILVKGILSTEDAVDAINHGVSGIIVSNHGARQLDTVPATIDVLGEIVRAVAGRCEVYMDGGVRTGTDVFKALALGARAVFIGRPVLYALAYDGENGVRLMLEILQKELSLAMALAGCATIEDIKPSFLRHESHFHTSKL